MPCASSALISAALLGLLLTGVSACNSENDSNAQNGATGGGGSGTGGGAGQACGGSGGASGAAGGEHDGAAGSAGNVGSDARAPDSSEDAPYDAASADGSSDVLEASADGVSDGSSSAPCLNPSGMIPDGSVSSTTIISDMTLEKFAELCNQRGGAVQLICHCGGANTCKGLSFDTTTMTLSEHTCQGMNTCAGYSCVIP